MSEAQAWVDKLAAMGTPTRIAKFLSTEGIQGTRMNALMCPLANFLTVKAPDPDVSYMVGTNVVEVRRHKEVEVIQLPTILRVFVSRFDTMGFPYLVDPHNPCNPL